MRNILLTLMMLFAGCVPAFAQVTTYTENTTPHNDDVLYLVDDPGGTPANNKIKLSTLATFIDTDTDTTYTAGGTLLDLTAGAFSVLHGTLTNGKICIYVTGTGLVCNSDDATDDTVSGTELDGVFSTTGFLKRTGAGTYSTVATVGDSELTLTYCQSGGTNCPADDDTPDSDAEVPDDISISNTLFTAPSGGGTATVTGTLQVVGAGNVGIGTSLPVSLLDVADDCVTLTSPDASKSSCCVDNSDVFTCTGL